MERVINTEEKLNRIEEKGLKFFEKNEKCKKIKKQKE